ncbi:hypothetical protein B0H16DRAFT_1446646 [Mycena metata]|uniref:Uncharacterized protein n=1 Tax=Mycena metata TaxID=1033252 RepID=A0AAD7KGV0_9AGAR|nr:hypothetical protein B0H16DRAFT_1446646 [Mycena metata]
MSVSLSTRRRLRLLRSTADPLPPPLTRAFAFAFGVNVVWCTCVHNPSSWQLPDLGKSHRRENPSGQYSEFGALYSLVPVLLLICVARATLTLPSEPSKFKQSAGHGHGRDDHPNRFLLLLHDATQSQVHGNT